MGGGEEFIPADMARDDYIAAKSEGEVDVSEEANAFQAFLEKLCVFLDSDSSKKQVWETCVLFSISM